MDETVVIEEKKPTPLPKLKVFLVSCIMFINQFNAYMIYPFLPFFIGSFFPDKKTEELGYYISWFGSLFYVGTMIGSILWGTLSDILGRKIAVIMSLFGNVSVLAIFGLITNYPLLIIFRMIWGVFDEITGVAKTIMSEICDDSNQHLGFAISGIAFGLAAVLGPVAGGVLAEPSKNFPFLVDWFPLLEDYPYVVPFLFTGGITLILLFLVLFALPETLPVKDRKKFSSINSAVVKNYMRKFKVLKEPRVFNSILCYSGLTMILTIIITVIPLWFVNPIKSGGFSLSSSEIGVLLSLASPIQVVFQIFLYPYLVNKLGYRKMMIFLSLGLAGFLFIAPCSSFVNESGKYPIYVTLVLCISICMFFIMFAFTNTFVLVNNSVVSAQKGLVNGVAQSVTAFLNILAPIISGNLYAWSVSEDRTWPINHFLVFYIMIIIILIIVYCAYKLPPSIDLQTHEVEKSTMGSIEMSSMDFPLLGENKSRTSLLSDN